MHSNLWQILQRYYLTRPRRMSEFPQTFRVKGLTYDSSLSADIRMDTFWPLTRSMRGQEKISWL